MPEDFFGPLVSPEDVIQAALATLRVWLPEYCAEVERKHSLQPKTIPRPPTEECFHGGVDFESWIGEDLPEVIVTCKPSGDPERSGSVGYTQGYELKLGCLWVGVGSTLAEHAEDEARMVASYLGAASMLLVQQPTLGGLTERLVMTASPDVTLPNPEQRAIAQVVTGFEVWVAQILDENAGPVQPNPGEVPEYNGPEQPYGEEPTVQKVDVTVNTGQI